MSSTKRSTIAPITVFITGATSGIGRETALHLARKGMHVIASGRRQALLDSLLNEAKGLSLDVVALDVTSEASVAAAHQFALDRTNGRGVDVLVNNAGYGHLAPTELVSDAEMRRQFDTNVFGLMAVTRAFLPEMRQRGAGRIVNISSVGGRLTLPLFGVYNATKYAVESLSDALRLELRPFGVEVSLVEPGLIDTGFSDVSMGIVGDYDGRHGVYAPVLARAEQIKKRSDAMSVRPIVIARCIEHAATARRPRVRYVAPFSAWLTLALAAVLPTRLTDWLMRQSVGFTAGRLSAPTSSPAA